MTGSLISVALVADVVRVMPESASGELGLIPVLGCLLSGS